jgi:polysaccharide biosynthesis/export protein
MFKGLAVAAGVSLLSGLPVMAQSAYHIKPGDELKLEVLQDSSLNRSLLVLPDGTVSVPLVGTVRASGDTVDGLRSTLAKRLSSNFSTKPTVYLSVTSLAKRTATTGRKIPVFIMGQVTKPGKFEVRRGSTLLQFLAESGGLTKFAATSRIKLLRTDSSGKQVAYKFDYKAVMSGQQASAIRLQPGDVIVVPERGLFE